MTNSINRHGFFWSFRYLYFHRVFNNPYILKFILALGLICVLQAGYGQEVRGTSNSETTDANNITINNVITPESLGYNSLTSRTTENSAIGRNSYEVIHVDLSLQRLISENNSKTTLPFDVPFYISGKIDSSVSSIQCLIFETHGCKADVDSLEYRIRDVMNNGNLGKEELQKDPYAEINRLINDPDKKIKKKHIKKSSIWKAPQEYLRVLKKGELPNFSLLIEPLHQNKNYFFYFLIDHSLVDSHRRKLEQIAVKYYHHKIFDYFQIYNYDEDLPLYSVVYNKMRRDNERLARLEFQSNVTKKEIDDAFTSIAEELKDNYKESLKAFIENAKTYRDHTIYFNAKYLEIKPLLDDFRSKCSFSGQIDFFTLIGSDELTFKRLFLGQQNISGDLTLYANYANLTGRKKNLTDLIKRIAGLKCVNGVSSCCPQMDAKEYLALLGLFNEVAHETYISIVEIEAKTKVLKAEIEALSRRFVNKFEKKYAGLFLNLSTGTNFISRAEALITADLGFAWQFSKDYGNKLVPYFGANFNFVSINRQRKYCLLDFVKCKDEIYQGKRWLKPFSFTTGLTFGNDYSEDLREGIFPGTSLNLITGLGVRVTDFVRVNGGIISYRHRTNNILANEMRYTSDYYISISLDLDVERFLGNAFNTIF